MAAALREGICESDYLAIVSPETKEKRPLAGP